MASLLRAGLKKVGGGVSGVAARGLLGARRGSIFDATSGIGMLRARERSGGPGSVVPCGLAGVRRCASSTRIPGGGDEDAAYGDSFLINRAFLKLQMVNLARFNYEMHESYYNLQRRDLVYSKYFNLVTNLLFVLLGLALSRLLDKAEKKTPPKVELPGKVELPTANVQQPSKVKEPEPDPPTAKPERPTENVKQPSNVENKKPLVVEPPPPPVEVLSEEKEQPATEKKQATPAHGVDGKTVVVGLIFLLMFFG